MNYTGYTLTESVKNFMYRVYAWMAGGLALTAATSYYIFSNPTLFNYIFRNWFIVVVLFIAQLGFVISLQAFINKMNYATAITLFIGYSILTGITLSSIFFIYTMSSIYLAFGVAAAMFAVMALYGYFTNEDLTTIGSIAQMGLFGLIIALFANLFFQNANFDYIMSFFGVGVFTLLTAYDNQRLKQLAQAMLGQGEMLQKVSLIGALTLYLDFINLFLFLLRIFGQRRND